METAVQLGATHETWMDRALPWASSSMMHAGLGLVVAFVAFVIAAPGPPKGDGKPLVDLPPDGLADLGCILKPPPKGEEGEAAQSKAYQNLVKTSSNGIDIFGDAKSLRLSLSGMLDRPGDKAEIIGPGPGSVGTGNSNRIGDGPGMLATYGDRMIDGGQRDILPRVNIRARRIVYLLDHSGSMLDSFDFLREEVIRRTRDLHAAQNFSVIMFSEDVTVLGPDQLQRATPNVKSDVASRMRRINAGGMNDGALEPFKKGFEKAFAMKPQIIIFLTDGNFDPRLVEVVGNLNRDKVQIETIAYVQIAPDAEESLKKIAKEGHGNYKFVSRQDLK